MNKSVAARHQQADLVLKFAESEHIAPKWRGSSSLLRSVHVERYASQGRATEERRVTKAEGKFEPTAPISTLSLHLRVG